MTRFAAIQVRSLGFVQGDGSTFATNTIEICGESL